MKTTRAQQRVLNALANGAETTRLNAGTQYVFWTDAAGRERSFTVRTSTLDTLAERGLIAASHRDATYTITPAGERVWR